MLLGFIMRACPLMQLEFLHQYFQAFRLSEVSAEECEQAQGRSNVLKSGGAITR